MFSFKLNIVFFVSVFSLSLMSINVSASEKLDKNNKSVSLNDSSKIQITIPKVSIPKISGDLRFRFDRADKEGSDSRFRQRIRARVSAKGKVDSNIKYHLRLTTGAANPITANQSLDSGFSTKDIRFDLAYLSYEVQQLPLLVTLGKFKNPFFRPGRTELLWDGDLNPEGINIHGGFGSFFFNLAYLFAEERKSDSDTVIHSAQIGVVNKFEGIKVKAAAAIYDYLSIEGRPTLFDESKSLGNTTTSILVGTDQVDVYSNGYSIVDLGLQIDFYNLDLSVYANGIKNVEISENSKAFLAGFSYGKKIKFNYNYRKVEADAVLGVFTDSDFKGGGSDGIGHEFGLSYKITKNQRFTITHFYNETAVDNGADFHRTFLDYGIKF